MSFSLLTTVTRRFKSFFVKRDAPSLWKQVTSVSIGGIKKGRMRAMKKPTDLNRGQILGVGPINVKWPGLNAPVVDGLTKTLDSHKYLEPDKSREEKLFAIRRVKERIKKRIYSLPLYERGWSGIKWPGRIVDNPSPVGDEDWSSYKTYCLFMHRAKRMTTHGRKWYYHTVVAMGNGDGLIATSVGLTKNPADSIKMAVRDLPTKVQYVHRMNGHTIYQNFMGEHRGTRIICHQMPAGYGIVAHRVIKILCDLCGIKDLAAVVDGNGSKIRHVVNGFLVGLMNQETHHELAERKQMHVLELRQENNYLPTIVASPVKGAIKDTPEGEIVDVEELYSEGRQPWAKPKFGKPWYLQPEKSWTYRVKLELEHPFRNQKQVQMRLLTDFVLDDWTPQLRCLESRREHRRVLMGEKPMPIGIGLTNINRQNLEDVEEEKT